VYLNTETGHQKGFENPTPFRSIWEYRIQMETFEIPFSVYLFKFNMDIISNAPDMVHSAVFLQEYDSFL